MTDDLIKKIMLNSDNEQDLQLLFKSLQDLMVSFLTKETNAPLHSDLSLPELESLFSETSIPPLGRSTQEVFSDIIQRIVRNSVRISHPRFIGHMTTALPYFSFVTDAIISLLNQNVVKIETALSASFVEKQTLAWMHRLIFNRHQSYYDQVMHHPELSLGNVTNGGTLGNITAMTIARQRILPQVNRLGMVAAMRQMNFEKVVILASNRVHYSFKKTASLLGIGSDHILTIPVHPRTNAINLDALQHTLNTLGERTKVMAIVGVGGTTETGNIDPLDALADIAEQHGTWFHVDAAWGGALLLSPSHRAKLRGIERADSVVIDGHKFLYLSMAHGMCLLKREHDLQALTHNAHYIIRKGSVDLGRTSLEGSRPFSSLKLWASMHLLGAQGYATLIDHALLRAQQFATAIKEHPFFELMSAPETNILTYRFVPSNWAEFLESQPSPAVLGVVQTWLNELNTRLQKRQRRLGKSFVSRTLLESCGYSQECVVLRAVIFNPLTTTADLTAILQEQQDLGCELMQGRWSTLRLSKIPSLSDFFMKNKKKE